MALKDTSHTLMKLLEMCVHDLHKAAGGNKAAAQRVRTGTIKLTKISKVYRKESLSEERKENPKKARKKTSVKKSKSKKK